MISVIVPVFCVEQYLEKCLDSIIEQTYQDLEILLIDDGSPDGCGEICNRYAIADPRIRVFHSANQGLSAARNLGLSNAKGSYIGFVDSDDWIEPKMFERLLTTIEENKADIAVCGRVMEFPDKKEIIIPSVGVMDREDAVKALALLKVRNPVWDKLWKRECFEDIRFPIGRVYEDIATTYRIFLRINRVVCIPDSLYHYRIHEGSISHSNQLKNLVDYFYATKTEKEDILSILPYREDEEIKRILFQRCEKVAARLWIEYCNSTKDEQHRYDKEIQDLARFARESRPAISLSGSSIKRWMSMLLCGSLSGWSIIVTRILTKIFI